jgi:ABC-type transporter Mla subunit MlaD
MIMRAPADLKMPAADAAPQADELLRRSLPVRKARRELLVGVFVFVGIAVILAALFTLTDASMFHRRYEITTIVTDASGLRNGDPVRMRGVNIGRVRRFDMVPEG